MTSPRGYLLVRVEEASGKTTRGDAFTWDTTAGSFEAFVKVELRGGERNIKANTSKAPLINDTITWRENLKLEVLDGSNELRIMLCREKYSGVPAKKGTSVIAACGIFVNDIIDAVPIDKYFELFKPNNGGEGGQIRVCLNFSKDPAALDVPSGNVPLAKLNEDPTLATAAAPVPATATTAGPVGTAQAEPKSQPEGTVGRPRNKQKVVVPVVAVTAVTVFGAVLGAVIKAAVNKRK